MTSSEVPDIVEVGRQGLEPWTYGSKAPPLLELFQANTTLVTLT